MENRAASSLTSFAGLVAAALAGLSAAQSGTETTAAWAAPRTSWGDPDLAGIYSNDDETGTPLERPDELEGLTLDTITPEKIAEIVAERDRRFKAQVDSEAWRNSISPPPHLIFDTFDRQNKKPWLITSDTLVVETTTFDDSTTWERSWTYSMPLTQVDHTQKIYEYACHEGNLAMRNILSGARAAEAAEHAGRDARGRATQGAVAE
jgi:hypothetical protein